MRSLVIACVAVTTVTGCHKSISDQQLSLLIKNTDRMAARLEQTVESLLDGQAKAAGKFAKLDDRFAKLEDRLVAVENKKVPPAIAQSSPPPKPPESSLKLLDAFDKSDKKELKENEMYLKELDTSLRRLILFQAEEHERINGEMQKKKERLKKSLQRQQHRSSSTGAPDQHTVLIIESPEKKVSLALADAISQLNNFGLELLAEDIGDARNRDPVFRWNRHCPRVRRFADRGTELGLGTKAMNDMAAEQILAWQLADWNMRTRVANAPNRVASRLAILNEMFYAARNQPYLRYGANGVTAFTAMGSVFQYSNPWYGMSSAFGPSGGGTAFGIR